MAAWRLLTVPPLVDLPLVAEFICLCALEAGTADGVANDPEENDADDDKCDLPPALNEVRGDHVSYSALC